MTFTVQNPLPVHILPLLHGLLRGDFLHRALPIATNLPGCGAWKGIADAHEASKRDRPGTIAVADRTPGACGGLKASLNSVNGRSGWPVSDHSAIDSSVRATSPAFSALIA